MYVTQQSRTQIVYVRNRIPQKKPITGAGPDAIKPVVLGSLKSNSTNSTDNIRAVIKNWPDTFKWKKAIVTPRFKKGDKCDPGNYGSILLTCICCKLMKHIIVSNLTKHLNKHNVLYNLQHGFKEKRSCGTQHIQLVAELARGLSHGQQIVSVRPLIRLATLKTL